MTKKHFHTQIRYEQPFFITCGIGASTEFLWLQDFPFWSSSGRQNQLVIRHPNIVDIIEGSNTITSLLASKLSRNVRFFAEAYDKDNHYLCNAASLPPLTPDTILETLNCSWCQRILNDDPDSLKSVLTVTNHTKNDASTWRPKLPPHTGKSSSANTSNTPNPRRLIPLSEDDKLP